MSAHSRYVGALVGLAVGDALGTTVEFKPPGSFPPVTDMTGGGPFRLRPGEWTDDTSMALCLGESLAACGGFDARDQMSRYVRWRDEGYLSSTGECFDCGTTTSAALDAFKRTGDPFSGLTSERTAGNGSLMRLAPVALWFAADPALAVRMAGESSRTTHGAPQAVDACRFFAALIVGALQGKSKADMLAPWPWWVENSLHPLHAEVRSAVARSSVFRTAAMNGSTLLPDLPATGYVLHTLEAALWAFATTETFEAGALRAVNLGNDADTTGAVFGQIAGAFYGVEGIPARWRSRIAMGESITGLADAIFRGVPWNRTTCHGERA